MLILEVTNGCTSTRQILILIKKHLSKQIREITHRTIKLSHKRVVFEAHIILWFRPTNGKQTSEFNS